MKKFENMTHEELVTLLKYATKDGIVDLSHIQNELEMTKRQEILEQHKYEIWQGKDGYYYTYLPDKVKGRVKKKRKNRKDLENLVIENLKLQMDNPTVEEVFKEWNDRKLKNRIIAKSTYDRNNQIYNRHFKVFGKLHIKSVEPEMIEDFLVEQISEFDLDAKGLAKVKGLLIGVFKRAQHRKLWMYSITNVISDMDSSDFNLKKRWKAEADDVFSADEIKIVFTYLKEHPDRHNFGIMLLFVTGMRVGELVALKYTDFTENTIRIQRTERKQTNENGKTIHIVIEHPKTAAGIRTVPVPDSCKWILEGLKNLKTDSEYVFISKGKRMSTDAIRSRLYRVCKNVGIPPKSPHKARKAYASILLDNHVDDKMIELLMGHTDIICTKQYYHRDMHDLQDRITVINRIPEFQSA